MKKGKAKKKQTPGPKPELLKIKGGWIEAVKKSLTVKKPTKGWPK